MTSPTDLLPREHALCISTPDGWALVDHSTGESRLIGKAKDGELALVLAGIKRLREELNFAADRVQEEVLHRMDQRASWTANWGGVGLKGASPATERKIVYPTKELRRVLMRLKRRGLIDAQAIEEAIEVVPASLKTRPIGVQKLLKLGGEVEEAIRAVAETVPGERRRVSVTAPEKRTETTT